MREFFKGWRRKLGVVTLLMACGLMAGWLRSQSVLDRFFFSQQHSMHPMLSMDGVVSWRILTPFGENLSSGWSERPKWISSELTQNSINNYKLYWDDGDVHWHWQCIGFDFGAASFERLSQVPGNANWMRREEIWQIPYWAITIPLTLFSLWLLVWKPRKSTPKKIIEPIPEKVA